MTALAALPTILAAGVSPPAEKETTEKTMAWQTLLQQLWQQIQSSDTEAWFHDRPEWVGNHESPWQEWLSREQLTFLSPDKKSLSSLEQVDMNLLALSRQTAAMIAPSPVLSPMASPIPAQKPIPSSSTGMGASASLSASAVHKESLNKQISTVSENASLDFSSPAAFVASIGPFAKEIAARLNVPVEGVLAQAALETGWGKSASQNASGEFHLFGIKATASWKGSAVVRKTSEFLDNQWHRIHDAFRVYGSPAEAFQDYAKLLETERYTAARSTPNVRMFAEGLVKGGYATDPSYIQKIVKVADNPVIQNWVREHG